MPSQGPIVNKYLSLGVFLVAVVGIGMFIGIATPPGDWYAGLAKPSFNPPNWLFAPVWTILYILIAIVGWRTWRREPAGIDMKLWFVQMALNFAWSPVFFAAHAPAAAIIIIALLLWTIGIFIARTLKSDPPSAWMFLPYFAWVSFATLLNAAILRLN
nr:TspO/MBR family protein [Aquamicrobium sp. NLF2-7]